MSGSNSNKRKGTRRSTILNRRSSTAARLTYYAKRFGIIAIVLGCLTYGGFHLAGLGWYQETAARLDQSFNEKTASVGFSVENLMIEGRNNIDRDQLKTVIDITKNKPIFAYDLNELKSRLETLSWVKTATIERRLPSTIFIQLQERVPVALWQRQGKLALVDNEGTVIADQNLQKFKDFIIIIGENAPQNAPGLIGLLNAEPDLAARVNAAKWIGNRRWDIELKNGITVHLPENDEGLAIKRLADAQKNEGILDRRIQSVDLRDQGRLIVQTSPGAVDKYEASFKPEKNI